MTLLMLWLCGSIYLQTDRALIVAIDSYPDTGGWTKIHATNDTLLLLPLLQRYGYSRQEIQLLTNEQATKKAIVYELQRLAASAGTGDHIFIHFSCHGQQMADDNGDEPDGLDEAIIPYDARRRYSKGVYEGKNHLRDDELGVLLNNIRRAAGPEGSVTLVVDACHSGTIDRDYDPEVYVRGTTYIFAPDNYIYPPPDPSKFIHTPFKCKLLAPIAIFAACGPDELNYEFLDPADNRYYDSLTYAFCWIMETLRPGSNLIQTWQSIRDKMEEMNTGRRRKQTPFLESTDEEKIYRISCQ